MVRKYYMFVHVPGTSKESTHRFLFVGVDDVAMESLYHQQSLAERPGALPEHLVRLHGDDGAQSKYERMDVLHVEIVGGHRVRYRVV